MLVFTLKRLAGVVPTLFILLTATFLLVHLAPGSPLDGDRPMPAEIRANLEAKYHLDEPLVQQYGRYLLNIAQLDFGASYQYKDTSVNDLIATGFPVSLAVGGFSLLFALVLGIPLGILAAVRQNKPADYGAMGASLAGISVPNFVLGPLMILAFAVYNDWLPAGGLGGWQNYVMPVIALGTMYLAYVTRLMRAATIEVLRAPFIRTARAKGLSETRVFVVHVLPAALLPVISFLGPGAAAILTGSVVVEQIFGIPGLGRFFVTAALNRDYTLVLGITLFYGIIIIAFNLVVDVLYGWLDPRVAYR